jgi:hypothetical protein
MEYFRTIVQVPVSEKKVFYNVKVMFIGSCFSEYMGNNLSEARFKVDNNPFGIVYNPLSVKRGLDRLIDPVEYTFDDLFLYDYVWYSFDHHSRFSDVDKEVCLSNINERLKLSAQHLKESEFLFITFGSSNVYFLKSTGKVVSNCHKLPAGEFTQRRISVEEIVTAYNLLLTDLWKLNPNLHIVFTVSPIRHWKDGPHENQLNKAVLLLAVEEICKAHKQTFYFPSYELMMDDLRDYRFYDEDMLHPNKTAIHYIWQRFKESFMGSDTIMLMKEVEKVVQARSHKPFNPGSEAFQAFVRQSYDKIQYLKDQYKIDLTEEENYFRWFFNNTHS